MARLCCEGWRVPLFQLHITGKIPLMSKQNVVKCNFVFYGNKNK